MKRLEIIPQLFFLTLLRKVNIQSLELDIELLFDACAYNALHTPTTDKYTGLNNNKYKK